MRRRVSVTSADGPEVHDALNKARHVCERRRDVKRPCPGERPVSRDESSHSHPPTPSLPRQALFPWQYDEPLSDARTPLGDFFRILLINGSITLA
jgi:hypothetical protein